MSLSVFPGHMFDSGLTLLLSLERKKQDVSCASDLYNDPQEEGQERAGEQVQVEEEEVVVVEAQAQEEGLLFGSWGGS